MGILKDKNKKTQDNSSHANNSSDGIKKWLEGNEKDSQANQNENVDNVNPTNDNLVGINQPTKKLNITEEKIKAVEEFLQKEKDKSFKKGVLLGVVAFAIVILITTLVGWFPPVDTDYKLRGLEHMVNKYYLFQDKVDEDAAKEATYKGFIDSLGDPYSTYMSKKEFEEFSESLDGEFCGVGIMFFMDPEVSGSPARVTDVLEGYTAEKNGIKVGDLILSIDGKSITNNTSAEVAQKMKGEEGSKVKVDIYRESTQKQFTVELTREKIKAYTVSEKVLDNDLGYIHIREFDKGTANEFKKAVDRLLEQNVKGIIIDLRGNSGGLLNETTEMLDYLLPKGDLVTTRYKDGSKETIKSDNKHQVDKAMAILINGMTASASELFTGAMQDYGRAVAVGTQSFGKGIVQNVYTLKDGSGVKLTVAEYLTPKNRHIHKKGITPDIKVEESRNSLLDPNDAQLRAAEKAILNK